MTSTTRASKTEVQKFRTLLNLIHIGFRFRYTFRKSYGEQRQDQG